MSSTHTTSAGTSSALAGTSIIGANRASKNGEKFHAVNPATGEALAPDYFSASLADLDRAATLAAAAFPVLSHLPMAAKAEFLRKIAANIEALGQDLFDRIVSESALPAARAQAETGRTCNQLRLFADVVAEGSWVDARIDRADPDRKPARRPDLRSMLRPLGPVAVFGASNFPMAYSVAGGDTASAFASGSPVIVKAHPAHPGTSELVGAAIVEAVHACGLPEGTFSLLYDSGYEIAAALVKRPEIKAVGFTGSRRGGRALMDAMATRPDPIPFYAEMSSVNPIFLLPGVLRQSWEDRIAGLFASVTMGAGQFCTKPGLVFVEASKADAVAVRMKELMSGLATSTLLTPGIGGAYNAGVSGRSKKTCVATLAHKNAAAANGAAHVEGALFRTDAKSFLGDPSLSEEVFGPSALLIDYSSGADLLEIARGLEGQLTATVHGTPEDLKEHEELLAILEQKAGRLIFNGFPTGVEVGHATVHGGPWPATSDGRSTSVGSRAITRFGRLVCYQDFPQASLPDELKDVNPFGIWRTLDGKLTRDPFGA